MDNKIMKELEILEDRIESIKWLITMPSFFEKAGVSAAINNIRKSAGILKSSQRGTIYENKVRKEWKNNLIKRIS